MAFVDIHREGIGRHGGKPVHTVPQIFVDQTHVGGFTEFDQYVRDQSLLATANA